MAKNSIKEVQSHQVEEDSDVFIAPEAQKVTADQKVSPAPTPLAQEVPKQTEQKNEVSTRLVPPGGRRKFQTPRRTNIFSKLGSLKYGFC